MPLNDLNAVLAQYNINYVFKSYTVSQNIVLGVVSMLITAFSLPLRSICCTILYRDIINKNYAGKIAAEKLAQRAGSNKKKNIEDD